MGEGIVLYDLMGDEDAGSLMDLTGVDKGDGEAPSVGLIVAGEACDGEEWGQEVFNGEAAGEPVGESEAARTPPTPTGLVWLGTVIGAADHGG